MEEGGRGGDMRGRGRITSINLSQFFTIKANYRDKGGGGGGGRREGKEEYEERTITREYG